MAAEACDLCGAATPADARFCPQCGTGLDVEVVDLTGRRDASDEGTVDPHDGRSRSRVLPLAIGAIVVAAIGVVLFTGDGEPEDPPATLEPAPTATASARTDDLRPLVSVRDGAATVDPIHVFDGRAPLGAATIESSHFVVTSDVTASKLLFADGAHRALEIIMSEDLGQTWTAIDHDLPSEAVYGALGVVDDQLVLAGTDNDGGLTLWRSADGSRWTPERLAPPLERSSILWHPTAVAETPLGIVLTASQRIDESLLDPLVPAGAEELRVRLVNGGGVERVVFIGPFGFEIEGPGLEDPTITDEMRETLRLLNGNRGASPGAIWTGADGVWTKSDVTGHATDIVVFPDESVLVLGFAGAGSTEWTPDGAGGWDRRFAAPDLSSITSWNDQVIAAGSGDLRIRNERGGWESYGLYGALPDTLDDAFVVQAGANDDLLGVAMIVDGPGPQSTGSSLLTKDGFVLRYDALGFALTVTTPEGRDIGFAPWQQTLPDGVMLSATDGLTVVDRDSGDEVTFTFAEMAELDQVMAAGFRGSQAVVLLTADGGTWAAGVTGPDAIVSQLLPMGKHMLAVMAWMEWSGHGAEVRATRLARVGLD